MADDVLVEIKRILEAEDNRGAGLPLSLADAEIRSLRAENAELKAEVERLAKRDVK